MKKEQILLALQMFVLLIASRLIPHPLNFTALTAVALFSGSLWKSSPLRFVVPLLAIFLTDLYIARHPLFAGPAYSGLYPGAMFTYAAIVIGVLLAPQMLGSFFSVALRGLLASVVFFVLSNFGVWLQADLYPHTTAGLIDCYVMAIPFFHNTLISTWFYSLILYGAYRLMFAEKGFEGFFKLNHGRSK